MYTYYILKGSNDEVFKWFKYIAHDGIMAHDKIVRHKGNNDILGVWCTTEVMTGSKDLIHTGLLKCVSKRDKR